MDIHLIYVPLATLSHILFGGHHGRCSASEKSDLTFLLLYDIVQARQQLLVTNLLPISVYDKLSFNYLVCTQTGKVSLHQSCVQLKCVMSNASSFTQVEKIRCNHVGESLNRNLIYRFRTFCASRGALVAMIDLAAKNCVPCTSKDLQAMTEESATEFLLKVAGWNLVNENGTLKLNRSWRVRNFTKGLELFQLVGTVAETEGHHPDLHLVGWNNVTIEIWTHAVGENFLSIT
ncbi:hypothetical protein SADUNF_Sadunf16G0229200 [Salix dunnii]|uniref:4a-hydroxytetrahydrobiopterin dehydratase n=1 Tax=Salix dunnii TaxID=1413687 RepID=A0A835JBI0_9ROSI|nr:hypothetical protein SADUNF_Sadunf16G0229200 [Salix dunnii]